jgi:hypothetical protein
MLYKVDHQVVGKSMKLRSSIIAFVIVVVAGCAASTSELQRLTAGKTGCPENAIKNQQSTSWDEDSFMEC